MGGLDGEDRGSDVYQQQGVGVLQQYFIYSTRTCIINYMCVCSSAQGLYLTRLRAYVQTNYIFPFSAKRPLNALCRM